MEPNEASARALAAQLAAAGIDARVRGEGLHWDVDAGAVASRSMRIHCFWYDRAITGLFVGLNPANARSRLDPPRAPRPEGPEYMVVLRDRGSRVADGRTREASEVVACARSWSAGQALEEVVREAPFIDEKGRAMRALARQIDPRLRSVVCGDPSHELWVYGDGRSCAVQARPEGLACRFLLGQASVGLGVALSDVPSAVAAWLADRISVRALASLPGVTVEPHAEALETDPARWHWLHVSDRIASPRDVLAPLRPLIETLASRPIATRFYSFSSLDRFCFSASSHYPWVTEGLPVIAPGPDGTYLVGLGAGDAMRCDLDAAVARVETTLARTTLEPFFGSAPHHELPLLSELLARLGSALRPELVQEGAFYRLVVADTTGTRTCVVDGDYVVFEGGAETVFASWPTVDDAVAVMCRYLEHGASLDEIASDPRAIRPSKYVAGS